MQSGIRGLGQVSEVFENPCSESAVDIETMKHFTSVLKMIGSDALNLGRVMILALPVFLAHSADSTQQQGVTVVSLALDPILGMPIPTNIVVTFPETFSRLPAIRVVTDDPGISPLPITSLTTNGFSAEVRWNPHRLIDQTPLPYPNGGNEGFPPNTCLSFVNGKPALASVWGDSFVTVSLANSEDAQTGWNQQTLELTSAMARYGIPLAATVFESKLCLLWSGNDGLRVTRAADAWGAQPWTTEVLAGGASAGDPGFLVGVNGRLAASVVRREQTESAEVVQMTLWMGPQSDQSGWSENPVAVIEVPPVFAGGTGLATRIGQVRGLVMVTVGIHRFSAWGPDVYYSAAYLADPSLTTLKWEMVSPQLPGWPEGGEKPVLVGGGYQWPPQYQPGLGSGPLDQWVEFRGQSAVVRREYRTGFGNSSWWGRPHFLVRPADVVRWMASSHAQLFSPLAGTPTSRAQLLGFGIPWTWYGLQFSRSLANPHWNDLSEVIADGSGALTEDLDELPAEGGFFRLLELQP